MTGPFGEPTINEDGDLLHECLLIVRAYLKLNGKNEKNLKEA